MARGIVRRRTERPFENTADLAQVVEGAKGGRRGARIHPATRTFQALRMHLNEEGAELKELLDCGLSWLRPGGRWAVITFHSGEDRPVKKRFAAWARSCHCPPAQPICTCSGQADVSLPKTRGWTASEQEIQHNPRARSARLRVAERVSEEIADVS